MTIGFYDLTYFLTFDKQLLKFSVPSTPNFSFEGDISPYQSFINEIQSKATQSIEICLYNRERIKLAFIYRLRELNSKTGGRWFVPLLGQFDILSKDW